MSEDTNAAGHSGPRSTADDHRVREILDQVAAGALSSEEAARLLAEDPGRAEPHGASGRASAESDVWQAVSDPVTGRAPERPATATAGAGSDHSAAAQGTAGAGAASGQGTAGSAEQTAVETSLPAAADVRRVTVRAIGRRVRLIGEPAISGVAVDGPHVIKRDGDTLSISSDGDMGVSIDGLSMLRTRSVGDLKSQVGGLAKELSIRVNPRLAVEIEVTAGTFSAERVPALSRVRVTAGTAKVADVDGPIDLLVQAGSASLDAQLTKGRSRVRVESGSATVTLRRGSDVRVHTEAQLGRVAWTGAVSGSSSDVEIGRGRADLDVQVLMGSAQITAD